MDEAPYISVIMAVFVCFFCWNEQKMYLDMSIVSASGKQNACQWKNVNEAEPLLNIQSCPGGLPVIFIYGLILSFFTDSTR